MRNFLRLTLMSFIIATSISRTSAQTYNFQWSTFGWTTSTYSGTLTNVGGSGVNTTVAITNSTGNASVTGTTPGDDNKFQNNTPKVGATSTVWLLPGTTAGNPLVQSVDWTTMGSNVTTVITFSQPVSGVSFYVGDIDRANGNGTGYTYIDRVTVTGKNGATTVPNPTIAKYSPTTDTIVISGNSAYANSPTAGGNAATTSLASNQATALFTIANAVTTVTIVYDEGPGVLTTNPTVQTIVIGDMSFTKTIAPVTTNTQNTTLFNSAGLTAITPFTGTDADGTVVGYTLETLPTAAMGTLTINGVAAVAGTVYTAADVATLKFTPNTTFTGDATFTFSVTDNVGLKSNISTYTIPVDPLPVPTTNNIVAPIENNSYGQTAIPTLSGAVASGTIASYTVSAIPAAAQGVLYLCNPTCAAVTNGQSILAADRDKLKFDPSATFTGTASFTYNSVSAAGVAGNAASYIIPVNNEPPVANTIMSAFLLNTDAADPIPALSGSDVDGTIASYKITSLPPAGEGVLYLCTPSCAVVAVNQVISVANAGNLQFDPTAAFVGTSRFTYTATDNSGNVSPAASYNVPVKGVGAAGNIAPYSDNVVAQQMNNSFPATTIPSLSSHDPEGTIASYTIETIPTPAMGVLTYNGGTTVTAGLVLTPAQMATLQFDPAPTFIGTASFTYSGTDNGGLKSNIANYSIPVVNVAPVANPINAPAVSNSSGQAAIPALSGHDPLNIASYTVSPLSNGLAGTLSLCNPTCTNILSNTTVAVADIGKLRFTPSGLFTGTASFTYTATDVNGVVSQSAPFTIPVINTSLDPNLPPTANNKTSTAIPNTNGQTSIPALSGSDPDGTVASYVINSLPAASQGVLYVCNPTCTVVAAGQTISLADVGNLKLAPTASYEGNADFQYTSVDNAGKTSSLATYTIPITGTAPRANNVTSAPMARTDGQTAIPSLSGIDPDGSITSYTINSLPPAASGTLFLCNPTCVAVTAGQLITAANAALLKFTPSASYTGLFASFDYSATDNSGRLSNTAVYALRITNGLSLLPVDLLSFTAEKKPGSVQLTWVAENEINLQSYVVERSTDGNSFSAIGTVNALGNTIATTYQYNDDKLASGTALLYYRLKSVDKDGKFKYSVIATVRMDNNNGRTMTVSPNPASDKITVKINADVQSNSILRIVNSYGATVYSQRVSLVKGDNYIFINNLAAQASGVYTVQTVVQQQVMVQKIIISR